MSATDVVAGRLARAQRRHGRERLEQPLAVLALAAAYYGAAELVFWLEAGGPVAAVVWLPAGVGIAALYLGGNRLWPGVLLGDLLANNYGMLPLGTALLQTCGNMAEILIAATMLRRIADRGPVLGSIGGVMAMLGALAAGVTVSATVGTLAQVAGGVVGAGALPTVWRTWWLGDFTGALVLVPLAIAWSRPPRLLMRARGAEAGGLLVALILLSAVATSSHDHPTLYLAFPALIWAALRFGMQGATLAVAVVTGFTVWNTSNFGGPFVFEAVGADVVSTQLFIVVAALTSLCLAAVVAEREAFGEGLRASRARLVEASDTERRKIVRNLHDGAQQRLSALAVHLRLAADGTPSPEENAALIARAGDELTLAIEELRELAHGLPPAMLVKLGLAGALRSVAARSSVPVTLVALPDRRVDDTAEATAFYVIAEAVTNAQRYSQATAIAVSAVVSSHVLDVVVSDNGVGGASEVMSSGLQGLRDRVEAIGGAFELASPLGQGTRVTAAIPAMIISGSAP
jgi:signal transduction histidine kinase